MQQFLKDGWLYSKPDVIFFFIWLLCLVVNVAAWCLHEATSSIGEIIVNVCLLITIWQVIGLKIDQHSGEADNEDSTCN